MICFLAGAICLIGAWDVVGGTRALLVGVGLALLSAFVVLVKKHSKTKNLRRFQDEMRRLSENALRRLRREWNELEEVEYGPPRNHPYAADLDLFGHASLFQLLGTAVTIPGREALRDWLIDPAGREEVLQRQQAVSELTPHLDYRNRMEAYARMVGHERPQALHAFVVWAKGDDWILTKPVLIWAARLLPLATLSSIVANLAGTVTFPIWAFTIGMSVAITLRTYSRMHAVFNTVASGDSGLRRYGAVFESAAEERFESPLLSQLVSDMAPAADEMRRLDQLVGYADVRYSGMLYGFLQTLLMWDHNVLCKLEHWRRNTGPHIEGWIAALGQLEALSAMAALAHSHPDWVFPEVSQTDDMPDFDATGLGHPLLPADVCIVNDVRLGPPGKFLFVTGSNMSGKSTLLRSIGVNTVLALAGGPVYASYLRLPVVSVFTSMRVADSLEQGISQYMAQLNRLKLIVDGASEASTDVHKPQALFLLDEILQGTNSSERLIAVRRIIRRLLECRTIGAVTSHELTVPDVPQLSDAAEIVHFRETAEQTAKGVSLSFDYLLRPGIATSTNALKLMEMVGLD